MTANTRYLHGLTVMKIPRACDDATWARIVAAAHPYEPNAEARGMLDVCLYEFNRMKSGPTRTAGAFWSKETSRLSASIDEFTLARDRGLIPWGDEEREILHGLQQTRHDVETKARFYRSRSRARQGRRDPALDFLYTCLIHIWTHHFGGKRTVSVRFGQPPGGAMVRFLDVVFPVFHLKLNPYSLRTKLSSLKAQLWSDDLRQNEQAVNNSIVPILLYASYKNEIEE